MALPKTREGAMEFGAEAFREGRGIDENPYIDEDGWPWPGYTASQAHAWEQGWLDEEERADDGTSQ